MTPEHRKAVINRLGWVAAGVVLLLFIIAIASTSGSSNSNSPQVEGQRAAQTPPPAPLAVTALQLARDYHRNEVAADAKYKGRRLAVTGVVTSISKDITDSIYLTLGGDNMFLGVHAELRNSESSKAMALDKGDKVTVNCEGGPMIIGIAGLEDCVIQ